MENTMTMDSGMMGMMNTTNMGMPGMMPGTGMNMGMPNMAMMPGMNMMMMPRCTMTVEMCEGGMKMMCRCDDEMAAQMMQSMCKMMDGAPMSCCLMMNGMPMCCCNDDAWQAANAR